MYSRLYETKLANHQIFKDLKDGLQENPSVKLRNLIHLKDDVLYVWFGVENCLLSLNLTRLDESDEETPYQKLNFISPPAFTVERVMTSPCGRNICLWGSRGVVIAELPSRWGRGGLFDSGNQSILCKSYCLDERFLYSQGEIRRVHWHPTSLAHALVLVSDNTIRLYNTISKKPPRLVKILTIGQKPVSQIADRALLDSLGDTAVDFTPIPDTEDLLILRGNGDVYMISCSLEHVNSPLQLKLQGPLAMYPPADDNYGSESCSITIVGGGDTPPLVVVATCSAALYHCLILPNSYVKDHGDSHALFVVESVELNIVLGPDDNDLRYSYPVHLYPCSKNSYACVHAGGVHTVTMPIVDKLKDYALAEEEQIETVLSSVCSKRSVARHLVCTCGPKGDLAPPVGMALTNPPLATLLVLCDDGSLIARSLEPVDLEEKLFRELQLKNTSLNEDDINKLLKERQKVSFTAIIQEILTREVSQPILKVSKTDEPSPKENLEFVTQATMKLRTEYMCRQERALNAVQRKVKTLCALSLRHNDWCRQLQEDIDDIKLQSVVLDEKRQLADKHQDDLKYRCSALIRGIRASAAVTPAERELLAELQRYKRRGERLTEQIQALKVLGNKKNDEFQKWHHGYKKKEIALGKSHSDTISSILQQQTIQISTLIEEIKLLKDQLSLV